MRANLDAHLTATQAALYLRINVHTVYMWVRRGNLAPCAGEGRRKLYRLADVLDAERATRRSVRVRGGCQRTYAA